MKNVFYTLILAVVAFVGCEKLEYDTTQIQSEKEIVTPKETTKENSEDIVKFDNQIVVNGNEVIATNMVYVNDTLRAEAVTKARFAWRKNHYGITAEQRNITVAYANAKTTITNVEKGNKSESEIEDANTILGTIDYSDATYMENGETKELKAARLESLKVFNLDEIQPEAATKAVVTDTLYNRGVMELALEGFDAVCPEMDTLVRYYSYEVADPIVPTTDKWELVANEIINGERYSSVDHIQYYSDGSHELIKNYSARIPVSAKVLSDWDRSCKDFSQSTSSLSATSTDKVAANNGEVYWNNYTVVYGNDVTLNEASASNSWEIKEARELVVKENGEVVYTFPELNSSVNADNGNVKDNGTYADYTCTLTYTYDGTPMTLVAPGKINKEEEKPAEPVKTEGWEESSAKDELTDNSRITSVDYVWYEDGKVVDRQHFELTSARSLECLTNWTSEQEAYSQNTNAASFTTSSDADAKGEWSFNKTTVVIKNAATLADGSMMNNEWRAYEVTNIKVTYNGKSYEFSNKEIYVSDNANVDANGVYGDKLTYIYGDNAKYITAPGMITMKETPEEPEEPIVTPSEPKVKSMVQTVAPTGDKKGYVYTLIVNWDNGFSQPVVINNGVISTFDKVENLDASVNGLSLNSNGEWVLTIAEDAAENMTYITTDGKLNCQMSYTKAKRIGWDEGKTVNEHSSVHTSRYNVSVDGVITDTYSDTNTVVGTLSL